METGLPLRGWSTRGTDVHMLLLASQSKYWLSSSLNEYNHRLITQRLHLSWICLTGPRCVLTRRRSDLFFLGVSQVFDVETSDMLLEIRTNRLSTVQYCHACPTSNLLAIAFSNYAVEVWDLLTTTRVYVLFVKSH